MKNSRPAAGENSGQTSSVTPLARHRRGLPARSSLILSHRLNSRAFRTPPTCFPGAAEPHRGRLLGCAGHCWGCRPVLSEITKRGRRKPSPLGKVDRAAGRMRFILTIPPDDLQTFLPRRGDPHPSCPAARHRRGRKIPEHNWQAPERRREGVRDACRTERFTKE